VFISQGLFPKSVVSLVDRREHWWKWSPRSNGLTMLLGKKQNELRMLGTKANQWKQNQNGLLYMLQAQDCGLNFSYTIKPIIVRCLG